MRRLMVFSSVILTLLLMIGPVAAQEPQSAPPPAAPQGPVNLASLDNQGIKRYLLGPGDVIDIRVFGQPDLNSVVPVDSDGNLSALPFIEKPIPAKCRNEKEIQKDIIAAYSKLLNKPQISVRILERNSRAPATVFGAVRNPTRATMARKIRLNELMAVSGGFTERASGTIQILHTEPLMCPEPGEEAEALPLDGANLPFQVVKIVDLRSGKQDANPIIRPGDYVLVTEAEPVYITGSVNQPTGIYLRDNLTLSRALAMVGGPRKEAKLSEVKIWRQKPGTIEQEVIKVDYGAIKKLQAPDFVLQAYDVIEVPEANPFGPGRLPTTLLGALTGGVNTALTQGLPNRVIY